MYGLIACFDELTENYIKQIYEELAFLQFSTYGVERKGHRPHMTIAAYDERLNVENFLHDLQLHCQEYIPVPLLLSSLGTFFKSKTIFLTPKPSLELIQFHHDLHQSLQGYKKHSKGLYNPSNWIPHCTIANHLTDEQYGKTFDYCRDHFFGIPATLTSLVLIQPIYENGIVVEVNEIYRIHLKN